MCRRQLERRTRAKMRALLYILIFGLLAWKGLAAPDCAGVEGGSSVLDRCGICDGDNACVDPVGVACPDAAKDCAGYCGDQHVIDRCGVCDGHDAFLDAAGECCEPSTRDCAGFCTHQAAPDACGDCNGNNTRMDANGVCCNASDRGCDNLCFGATEDSCGVCGGSNEDLDIEGACCPVAERRCDGRCGGDAEIDACGICGGMNATLDAHGQCCSASERGCDGLCGNAQIDACGTCAGDNSPCCRPTPKEVCTEDGCSIVEADECSGAGTCSSEVGGCVCNAGKTGPYCNVEQDVCAVLDCGEHGGCQSTSGLAECFCDNGWVGQFCQFKTCSGRGAYDISTDECLCYSPFSNTTDCATCEEAPWGSQYVCIQTSYMTRAVLLPSALLENIAVAVKATYSGIGVDVFFPSTVYKGVEYDCGCKPVSASNSGSGARYSIEDADAAMNGIFVSHVDYASQSSAELEAIRASTEKAINRSIYFPPVFFMGMGLVIVLVVAVSLSAVACFAPSRAKKLISRYGAWVSSKIKSSDPEAK